MTELVLGLLFGAYLIWVEVRLDRLKKDKTNQ